MHGFGLAFSVRFQDHIVVTLRCLDSEEIMQRLYVTHCYLTEVQLRLADVAFQFVPEQT